MAHPRFDGYGSFSAAPSLAAAAQDGRDTALQYRTPDADVPLAPAVSLSADSLPDAASAPTAPGASRAGASAGRAATGITGEDELMALIVELRLAPAGQDGAGLEAARRDEQAAATGGSRRTGSRGHTQQSSSVGTPLDTLDLCHRKIASLPDEMANVLHEEIVRLALGYNVITQLPDNFAQLSRLRYLNIRANMISQFPQVLCELPSLEILDISRNKIRKLPADPGRLINLRVLSISNNRLRRLPAWLAHMRHLRILKVEQNPIEWPPPHISVMPPVPKLPLPLAGSASRSSERDRREEKEAIANAKKKAEDRHMTGWIGQVKGWIREHQEPAAQSSQEGRRDVVKDPARIAGSDEEREAGQLLVLPIAEAAPAEEAAEEAALARSEEPGPHPVAVDVEPPDLSAPLAGAGQDAEAQAEAEHDVRGPIDAQDASATAGYVEPIRALPGVSEEDRFDENVRPMLPATPPMTLGATSAPVDAEQTMAALADQGYSGAEQLAQDHTGEAHAAKPPGHGRNNSHSVGQPGNAGASRRGVLRTKKSLPELRTHSSPLASVRNESSESLDSLSAGADEGRSESTLRRPFGPVRRPPLPQSHNTGTDTPSSSPSGSAPSGLRKLSLASSYAAGSSGGSPVDALRRNEARPVAASPLRQIPPAGKMPAAPATDDSGAVEVERNSYFRRLSTLPPSTISKAVPDAVLKFVDATRGVLYALSQIHTALKQYILFATDERVSAQFRRVLDVASKSMGALINSLDRFDSLSRRGTPEPSVIRGVLIASRDSVATFRKVVSVLQLQLRALQSKADVRYTRTLLLMLYGSMAEVSTAWALMAPQVDAVLPYLAQAPTAATPQHASPAASTLPSIAEATSPNALKTARPNASVLVRGQRRRHAGSFSAQDVAQGATILPGSLPPFDADELASQRRRPAAASGTLPYATPSLPSSGFAAADSAVEEPQSGWAPNTPGAGAPQTAGVQGALSMAAQQGHWGGASAPAATSRFPVAARSVSESPLGARRAQRAASQTSDARVPSMPITTATYAGQGRPVVDGHLIELVAQVTSVASGVWTSLLEHLASLGVRGAGPMSPTPESSVKSTLSPGSARGALSSDAFDDGSSSSSTGASRRLRELRELGVSTGELTRRLVSTLDKVQEDAEAEQEATGDSSFHVNAADGRRLWEESSHFVRAIISISMHVKAASVEHSFPRSIMRALAELTSGAKDLTLHLHFLAPPSTSTTSRAAP